MTTTATYVMGIDSSTTATKAIVWDTEGHAVAEGRAEMPVARPGRGLYEQRPEDWWSACCRATRAAVADLDPRAVVALAVANQRETVAVLDRRMRPLRPAMLWCDERGRVQVDRVAADLGGQRVHDATGKPVELCPALYRILWLRDEERATFDRTAHFVDVQGYLNWRLSGELVTSWASADPFGLLDMRRFAWHTALMDHLDLSPATFAPVVAPGTPVGTLTSAAAAACGLSAGTIVVAGAGDGQAAGLGSRALAPGRAYCNLGTAVVAGVQTRRYQVDPAFRTLTSAVPGAYVCEALLRTGTSLISWFVEHFGSEGAREAGARAEERLERLATTVPPGAEGLVLLPHWNAAGTPHWDGLARGAVVGWTQGHGKAHFYRAVLEGLTMELRLSLDGIAGVTDEPIDRLVVTGGGARSPLWRQIVADVTGRTVTRVASAELTSLGAGMLAATGAHIFVDVPVAAEAMSHDREDIHPIPAHRDLYDALFTGVYRPLYGALRDITHTISTREIERERSTPGDR